MDAFKKVTKQEMETRTQKTLSPYFSDTCWYVGALDLLELPKVAIVGSRYPTLYGREQCARFAESLSRLGIAILSGGAIGIDTIANTIAHIHGSSCAILGSGLQQLHPSSNRTLFHELAHHPKGLLLTEFAPDVPPAKWTFPKRNFTLAALADFVLVIEAAAQSGSLITAKYAAELGTECGALPGPVDSRLSEGTNNLIQAGAHCISHPQQIAEMVLQRYQNRIF